MNRWLEAGRDRSDGAKGRRDPLTIDLPAREDEEPRQRPVDPAPRLVAPKTPRAPLPKLLLRTVAGSLGLALALGIAVGRLTAVEASGPVPAAGPTEVRVRGAGHLAALPGATLLGPAGLLTDAEAIRERLLATGVPETVSVERLLPAGVLVTVEEKRAVALLDWDPPHALAGDGTVLGPATAADLDWAGAPDLVLARGVVRSAPGFPERAALAGRVAAALSTRPGLDRLVSEINVSGGPFQLEVILRSPPLTILLTEGGFIGGLDQVAGLVPDLITRWPGLSRVDARVPDRLLVRSGPAEAGPGSPARSAGGPA